ncbi:MAG: bacteriochlorophyll 4-vinyl reductase [Myxococcota bacterium]
MSWAATLDSVEATARIGPNTIHQTLEAMRVLHGRASEMALIKACRLEGFQLSDGMVAEADFEALVETLRSRLGFAEAAQVLRTAGDWTGAYVARHRIPSLARAALARLPDLVALPMLLEAIRLHAWTFTGRGRFSRRNRPLELILEDHPCCRGEGPAFGGDYYAAAFQRLLRLVRSDLVVREVRCRRVHGGMACVFEVRPHDLLEKPS